jgi:hypothetical protein
MRGMDSLEVAVTADMASMAWDLTQSQDPTLRALGESCRELSQDIQTQLRLRRATLVALLRYSDDLTNAETAALPGVSGAGALITALDTLIRALNAITSVTPANTAHIDIAAQLMTLAMANTRW